MCSRCARPTPHTTGLTVQLTPDSDWQNRNFTLNNSAFPVAGDLLGQIKETYQQKQKWSQQTRYTKEQGLKGKKQHGCGRQSISIHKCPGTSASINRESLKMKKFSCLFVYNLLGNGGKYRWSNFSQPQIEFCQRFFLFWLINDNGCIRIMVM